MAKTKRILVTIWAALSTVSIVLLVSWLIVDSWMYWPWLGVALVAGFSLDNIIAMWRRIFKVD